MGAGDTYDSIVGIVIAATVIVGFWEVGTELGSASHIIEQALYEPQQFGVGLTLYYIGIDTWTPTVPASFLGNFAWLSWFYPFADGYMPHYSIESCIFSLVASLIVTWLVLHFSEWEFWWHGLGVAILTFILSWYIWTLIAWHFMFMGGEMIGLSKEQIYDIWHASATATSPPTLQYVFLATIPLSFIWLLKKVT